MAQNERWKTGIPVEESSGGERWKSGIPVEPEKPRTRGLLEAANDNVIEFANAAAGGVSAAANFIKPGNAVSSFIDENIIKAGEEKQSDVVKDAKRKLSEGLQNAQGIGDEVGAVGGYFLDNPLLAASQAVGSFALPGGAVKSAGKAAQLLGAGAKGIEAAGRVGGISAGAAMAGGDAAGTAYDLSSQAGATEDQAIAAGRQASVIPALVGGVTGAFGAERLLAGAKGFGGNALSRGLKSGLSEAGQEAVEEGVTQFEGQRAAMPYDATIDPTKGVAGAAAMGGIMGFGPGAVLGAMGDGASKPSEQMGIDPNAGPLSRAAAASVDSAPPPQLGFSPLAGTPIIYPDGSVTLNGEQDFQKRNPGAQPADKRPISDRQPADKAATPSSQIPVAPSVPPGNAGNAGNNPVPMEGRSLDELRQALRGAQDPGIRKSIAAEIRKRREAEPVQPSLIDQPGEISSVATPAQAFKSQTQGEEARGKGEDSALGLGVDGLDAMGPEEPRNEGARKSDFLSNLSNRQSFIDKGFDDLNVDELTAVQGLMLGVAKDDKVLKSVVELIPVDVVDVLRSQELTPEMVFNNPSVLKTGGVGGDANNPVSIPVDVSTAIVRAMASVAAKNLSIGKLPHSGWLPVDGGSANNAVKPTSVPPSLDGDGVRIGGELLGGGTSKGGSAGVVAEDVGGSINEGRVSSNGGAALMAIGGNQNNAPKDVAIINETNQIGENEQQEPASRGKQNKLKEIRDASRAADELLTSNVTSTGAGSDIAGAGVEPELGAVRGQGTDAAVDQPAAKGDAGGGVGSAAGGADALRPDGWRTTAIKAGRVARSLGLDPKGKRLKEIVAEIDAVYAGRNVQNTPSSTAGTEAQASPVEARAPEGSNAASVAGVPAATGAGSVQADGVAGETASIADLPGVEPGDRLEMFGPRGLKGNSWVLREKATGRAIEETRNPAKVRKLNTKKYEAVPIGRHLADLNDPTTPAYASARDLSKNPPNLNASAEPVQKTAESEQIEKQPLAKEPPAEPVKPTRPAKPKEDKPAGDEAFMGVEDAPIFYSALRKEIEGLNLKSAPFLGWQGQLQGLVRAGKVKADELEWTGISEWLKLQSGKVSKEDVLAYLGVQEPRMRTLESYANGMSALEAGQAVGVSESTVLRWTGLAGITRSAAETKGITPETRQEAIRLYESGMSVAKVAEQLAIGTSTVHRIVKGVGVNRTLPEVRDTPADARARAMELYQGGKNSYEVAEEVGVSQTTVARWAVEEGLSRGYSGAQALRVALGRLTNYGIKINVESAKNGQTLLAHSVYEAARFGQLEADPNVAAFERATDRIPYGEGRTYVPDIKVTYTDGRTEVEEIKPEHQLEDATVQAKAKAATEFYAGKGIGYRIVTERSIGLDGFDTVNQNADGISLKDRKRIKASLANVRWFLRRANADTDITDSMREKVAGGLPLFMGSKSKRKSAVTPIDQAVMSMAGDGKSGNDILKYITNASRSPYRRKLAKALIATGANPEVSIGGDMGGGAGFKFLAKYSRKNHEVTLSEAAADRAEQIFLHETTHAATLLALDKGGLFATQMNRLYESAKKQGGADGQYGMKNVGEFVAEAFTNPTFQKALKGMRADNGSLWDRFVNIVRRILGMEQRQQDMLSAVLDAGVQVMRENMPLRAAKSFRAEDGPAFAGSMNDMPENQAPGPQGDAQQGAKKGDAVADGFVRLYHGGNAGLSEIKGGTGHGNIFGGIFTSKSRTSAASHGDGSLYSVDVQEDKVLSQGALDELDQSAVADALRSAMPWLDDADFDIAYEAVVDDRADRVDGEDLTRVFREDTDGEASWEAQRIRGELAKNLGFQAVEMNDEHGTSYLVLPGAKITPSNDQSAPDTDGAYFGIADAVQQINKQAAVKPVVQALNDTFSVRGKLHWWHKTVGTPFNLAERVPEFKRVFNSVQDFINSVSFYGAEAAAMAPKIIPKLESWKDLGKSPIKAEDNKAIAGPIFEGTLSYMRDAEGKPVQTDDVGKAGIVWTDGELRSKFGLTESQIGLYREFRAATDKSLTDLALSDILQFAGRDAEPIKDTVMGMSLKEGSETVIRYLNSLADGEDKVRKAMLLDTANSVKDKADNAQSLMDRGYAPLQRFGRHTLYATNDKGEQLFFGMYEDRWSAARAARQMREQYPGATVEVGMMSEQSYKMFQGISPETLELFGTMLGLDTQSDGQTNEAFQTYLKLAKSNRSALKRLIERKGISGYSEDASRVLASFIYSNARQTASNLHVGEIMNGVNDIPRNMGEAKDAAVKLARYTMDPQEEAQAIRGLLFAQYLGGSIASAAINALQPAQVTFPYLSQFVGAKKSASLMTGAVRDAIKKSTGDPKLDAELRKAEEEGIVSPQEIFQLMAQAHGKATLKAGDGTKAGDAMAAASNTLSRLSLGWGKVFSIPEQFNRRTTFIAAYRTAKETGEANPYEFAKQAVKETQLVYNKGNRPEWARGTIGALAFTFKTYSISYVELLQRMAASGPEGRRAALLMVGVLFLMAGAGGLPGVEDAEDVIDGIAQRVFGLNFQTRQKRQEWLADTFGEGGARFIENGLSGLPWSPTDVSGRLGLGNLIPGTGVFVKKQDYGRDVAELAGPAADMTKRFLEGAGLLLQGEFLKAGEIVSPTAVRNMIQGGRMLATDQYTDTKGRKVIDTTPAEGITKLIGFQPADVARVQEATGTMQRMIALNKIRESEIADKWAKGLAAGDPEQVQEARDELRKWNEANPESPIRINMPQVLRRVKALKEDKASRIARTAPKEIRQDVRRELERLQ